jgi:tellurite resistance-related uncharacterized protein
MHPKIPPNAEQYYRTDSFTEKSVPESLRHGHTTAHDIWAEIIVERGEVRYEQLEPEPRLEIVKRDAPGLIEPGVKHRVEPGPHARFHLAFYRTGDRDGRSGSGTGKGMGTGTGMGTEPS